MTEHYDVIVVGAGLSGVGAGARLLLDRPGTTFTVLEARDTIGGTWDLFRYPGVRSDSDMHTLGYPFRPWTAGQALADGPSILEYVEDTAREMGVDQHVRLHHRVTSASWSSEDARWTVTAERTDTGERVELTCGFLYSCTGYYRYDHGYEPEFEGRADYTGTVVHPQHWPADLDLAGKRVVVIGSGATAMTLVPAIAQTAAHVTMLQRSPTYVAALPSVDPIAAAVRERLPADAAYRVVRAKNIATSALSYRLSQRFPHAMRRILMDGVAKQLPEGYDVETHFGPSYGPWDQRLCVVPDGDLFTAISNGSASVVTDRIVRFTPGGLLLESGEELAADVVVTATGLELLLVGGMTLSVDGVDVDPTKTVAYKGMMLTGVPSFAFAIGYTNASWTLKCDLVSRYVVRLLDHMQEHGYDAVTPVEPPEPERLPLLDLSAGYVQRAAGSLPAQGIRPPWKLNQNYRKDVALLTRGPLDDEGVRFTRRSR
ncbi:flavin-containing monooxygenase [Longivirga aurantiaca]|uniref:Flavin-containing monooxygenase n=1 Tax=Longivirga aurantiaca TaxID=1837743 RepID=A0ABW1T3T3_9ACTN